MAPPRKLNPSDATLRARARKAIPIKGQRCQLCGKPAEVRHHVGGLHDNRPGSIRLYCRSCHAKQDHRIKANQRQREPEEWRRESASSSR